MQQQLTLAALAQQFAVSRGASNGGGPPSSSGMPSHLMMLGGPDGAGAEGVLQQQQQHMAKEGEGGEGDAGVEGCPVEEGVCEVQQQQEEGEEVERRNRELEAMAKEEADKVGGWGDCLAGAGLAGAHVGGWEGWVAGI